MADHIIQTRILLRYGTFAEWQVSNLILGLGEAAVCCFPQENSIEMSDYWPENTPPAIGLKIGDGVNYFRNLPWIQAVAADVYEWAKNYEKPTYTAQEIRGLANFIQQYIDTHGGGSGSGSGGSTSGTRTYQIVRGTGENINKYYLQYLDPDGDDWIVDTLHYIDVGDFARIANWIGQVPLQDRDLATFTSIQNIEDYENYLNYTDTEQEHKFVTLVSEQAGIIYVERLQPTFEDIAGTAEVSQGGTSRQSFPEHEVLVGNGTNALTTIPIAEEIDNNNYLVPNYLVKRFVEQATAGLTGAMHFIGEATATITNNSSINPVIDGYNFLQAQPGDVILSDTKEYVWSGSSWILLGDEGSYAVKGSIRDADVDEDAAIQQSKIYNLVADLNTKVDKVEGKTLTSNDFTDEYKNKLDAIEDNAQRNVIEHIMLNGTPIAPVDEENSPNTVKLVISEFDNESREKLESIEYGAEVNLINRILMDGVPLQPNENKVVEITTDPHTSHINKIESISINGTPCTIQDKNVNLVLDQAALTFTAIEGAQVPPAPNENQPELVDITNDKKLILARIAKTGNVKDLLQFQGEYITFNCGSSTTVI